MSEIILYPTETIYGLGVNALDEQAHAALNSLKGDRSGKWPSWLVRNSDDIVRYAEVSSTAQKIIDAFLPGSLTLVLPAKDTVPLFRQGPAKEVSFRISSDPVAQTVILEYMSEYDAPLTCTSANVSGQPTKETPQEILQQFGEKASMVTKVVDDGPRHGLASTVVRVVGDEVKVLREGAVSEADILNLFQK